jgi:cytochrome c oxidase cbb3-type subunit 3
MSSRCRDEIVGVVVLLWTACLLMACDHKSRQAGPSEQPDREGVVDSALAPGLGRPKVTNDSRALAYYDNADAVVSGKRLFSQYNCSGCHSNGGGGMGADLMDGQWIYGGRIAQIHQTLVEGRPNGMPSWGGKIPDEELWQLSAYVRSMSLPQTLSADTSDTPSQTPAPVPHAAEDDSGWSAPAGTTNDYGTTIEGPAYGRSPKGRP